MYILNIPVKAARRKWLITKAEVCDVKKVFIVAVCHFVLLRGGIVFYTPFSSILWATVKRPEIQRVIKRRDTVK